MKKVKYSKKLVLPNPEGFSGTINGKEIKLFTLTNKNGLRADITNYGGRIVSLLVPDKEGVFDDIVTGFNTIDEYFDSKEVYFGALIGRFGNRIAEGRFTIDGKEYRLNINNGPNHLHGGPGGFHQVVWDAEQTDNNTLKFCYTSPDMEEGFPGRLDVVVTYTLNDADELRIDYDAKTDKKTFLNLTSHPFFNLSGDCGSSAMNHMLKINADYFTPVNSDLIPTGEIKRVDGTPFDFREYKSIGSMIDYPDRQLEFGNGYDHNYVLNSNGKGGAHTAASVYDPVSGRKMELFTTEPGMQFYSGNFLSGKDRGKCGEDYTRRTSFCLETQHFPDSPNKPSFPSTMLEPGQRFLSKTIHRFSIL